MTDQKLETSAYYRVLAQRFLKLAAQMTRPTAKRELIDQAAHWFELAERAEKTEPGKAPGKADGSSETRPPEPPAEPRKET